MSALGQKQTYAVQNVMSALPQKRPQKQTSANGHVCFTPESGHVRCNWQCRLWAKSGHRDLIHYIQKDRLAAVSPKSNQAATPVASTVSPVFAFSMQAERSIVVDPKSPGGINS